jgi:hypothetical protein
MKQPARGRAPKKHVIDHAPSQPMRALPYLVAAREEREQAGDDVGPMLRMLFARAAAAAPRVRFAHQGTVRAAAFSPTARAWSPRATTVPCGCGTRGPASR